jgi:hypothetical protein
MVVAVPEDVRSVATYLRYLLASKRREIAGGEKES